MTPAIQDLNSATPQKALAMLAPLVERSDWVAEATLHLRPFKNDEHVAGALVETILSASPERRIALFRSHPELAGEEAMHGRMTQASNVEQSRLGLLALSADQSAQLTKGNAAYRLRFGYPFIIALHRVPSLYALFEALEQRLAASPTEEQITTLAEIASVIRSRSAIAFGTPQSETASNHIPTTKSQEIVK